VRPAWAVPDPSRIALVIGNDAYAQSPLGNAVNDAKAIGGLLERAGFTVMLKTDVDRDALRETAATFGAAARRGEVKQAFFYYAGHGAQLDWRNYLLPVDARVTSAADLPTQCLELGGLLADLSKARGKVFVLILDACRDNPFGGAYQPAQKGLSQFDAPVGTLLAFSTSPGGVAADGRGANGLYTENLVRELAVRGVRLEDALKRVDSRGAQIPWESTSLESDVFLFPAATGKLTEAELEADFQREIATWSRIKRSKKPEDWVAYLRDYPSGKFNEIAQNRLTYLLLQEEEQRALAKPPVVVAVAPPAAIVSAALPSLSAAPVIASATPSPGGKARPQLEVGAGFPLPVLMRPSLNPSSAGTYAINRRYSVGADRVQRVTRVDEEADRIELNNGMYVWDTLGNIVKTEKGSNEPANQTVPAELQIGRTWSSRFRNSGPGFSNEIHFDFKVAARESVRVPAGEFDSFRLEGEGFTANGTHLSLRIWLAPGLNFQLKSEFVAKPQNVVARSGELREMISCRQMRWNPT
jgi:hypothetical protein